MPSPDKLTIAQANFHMLWGGQAEVVLSLSKSLQAVGHDVIVISPQESELARRAADSGLETFTGCRFRKGFRPLAFFKDMSRLGALLRDRRVNIYHCHGSQDHWTGTFARNRYHTPTQIVRTRHNIYPIKNHTANRWLFRKQTAQVITIFGEQGKFFSESGLLRQDQLFTLHSPLPQEFVDATNIERVVRKELKLADATPLVGFVANFHPDKAPLDFVAMAERLAPAMPELHFAMAGHGPLDDPIRARIKDAGLTDRFHMLGFRKDILNVMASFDIVVLTSVTREASSTVLKQAAAVGLPVVATDVGGTREIVDNGKTGILIMPGDVEGAATAVKTILSSRVKASQMGASGKAKVLGEFTAKAIALRTESLYKRILASTTVPHS
jgi:glycosyltransferase involved in cell wall biosynthesis